MKWLNEIKLKELLKFLVGGGSAVITDFIIYFFLKGALGVSAAKGISFVCGSAAGFIINKLWTFESKRFMYVEIIRYAVLYAFSAMVNTVANHLVLNVTGSIIVAFLVATCFSTVINFIGQKFFVFRKNFVK